MRAPQARTPNATRSPRTDVRAPAWSRTRCLIRQSWNQSFDAVLLVTERQRGFGHPATAARVDPRGPSEPSAFATRRDSHGFCLAKECIRPFRVDPIGRLTGSTAEVTLAAPHKSGTGRSADVSTLRSLGVRPTRERAGAPVRHDRAGLAGRVRATLATPPGFDALAAVHQRTWPATLCARPRRSGARTRRYQLDHDDRRRRAVHAGAHGRRVRRQRGRLARPRARGGAPLFSAVPRES